MVRIKIEKQALKDKGLQAAVESWCKIQVIIHIFSLLIHELGFLYLHVIKRLHYCGVSLSLTQMLNSLPLVFL